LLGEHQRLNASCALSAILLANIKVSKRAIREGLRKVKWPGRFQIISKKPLVIVDGAHNPAGIKVLRVTIEEMFAEKFTVIFGCQKTKDYKKMLRSLKSMAKKIIITRSSHEQAAYLKGACSLKQAFARWDRKTPLLITGSLFLVADALKLLDA
jgi:dihydrofolate synthase/folylpolyglutamate synthase